MYMGITLKPVPASKWTKHPEPCVVFPVPSSGCSRRGLWWPALLPHSSLPVDHACAPSFPLGLLFTFVWCWQFLCILLAADPYGHSLSCFQVEKKNTEECSKVEHTCWWLNSVLLQLGGPAMCSWWGASGQLGEGGDCVSLLCTGAASSWVLGAVLGTTV